MKERFLSEARSEEGAEKQKVGRTPLSKAKAIVEPSVQIQMPASLLKELKLAAIEKETSVRAIVLEALGAYGFNVGEIRDRRRRG